MAAKKKATTGKKGGSISPGVKSFLEGLVRRNLSVPLPFNVAPKDADQLKEIADSVAVLEERLKAEFLKDPKAGGSETKALTAIFVEYLHNHVKDPAPKKTATQITAELREALGVAEGVDLLAEIKRLKKLAAKAA